MSNQIAVSTDSPPRTLCLLSYAGAFRYELCRDMLKIKPQHMHECPTRTRGN